MVDALGLDKYDKKKKIKRTLRRLAKKQHGLTARGYTINPKTGERTLVEIRNPELVAKREKKK